MYSTSAMAEKTGVLQQQQQQQQQQQEARADALSPENLVVTSSSSAKPVELAKQHAPQQRSRFAGSGAPRSLNTAMQGYVFVSQIGRSFLTKQRVSREYAILHKGSDSLGLEGMLEFYPSEGEMDKPVKALSMSSLLKVEKTKETQRKKHPFVLCAVGQKIELACKSKQERDMWVNALDRLIRASKNPSPVEPATDSTMKRTQDASDLFFCKVLDTLLSQRLSISGKECVVDMTGNEILLISSSGELDRWDADEIVHFELQKLPGVGPTVVFVLKSHDESTLFSVELLHVAHASAEKIMVLTTLRLQTAAIINKAVKMRTQEMRNSSKRRHRVTTNPSLSSSSDISSSHGNHPNRAKQLAMHSLSSDELDVLKLPPAEVRSKSLGTRLSRDSQLSLVKSGDSAGLVQSFSVRLRQVQHLQPGDDGPPNLKKNELYQLVIVGSVVALYEQQHLEPVFSFAASALNVTLEDEETISIHQLGPDDSVCVYTFHTKHAIMIKTAACFRPVRSSHALLTQPTENAVPVHVTVLHAVSDIKMAEGDWLLVTNKAEMQLLDVHTKSVHLSWPFTDIAESHVEDQNTVEVHMIPSQGDILRLSCENSTRLVEMLRQCFSVDINTTPSSSKRHAVVYGAADGGEPSQKDSTTSPKKVKPPPRPPQPLKLKLSKSGETFSEDDGSTPQAEIVVSPPQSARRKRTMSEKAKSMESVIDSSAVCDFSEPLYDTVECRHTTGYSLSPSIYDIPEWPGARRISEASSISDAEAKQLANSVQNDAEVPQGGDNHKEKMDGESGDAFVPTLVQRLVMGQELEDYEEVDYVDGRLDVLSQSSDADEMDEDVAGESSQEPAQRGVDVSPYAVFATQAASVQGKSPAKKRPASGCGYAQAIEKWATDPSYINPNTTTPQSVENWKHAEANIVEENKNVNHTYITVTDGRQPEPLPRQSPSPPPPPTIYDTSEPGIVGQSIASVLLAVVQPVLPSQPQEEGSQKSEAALRKTSSPMLSLREANDIRHRRRDNRTKSIPDIKSAEVQALQPRNVTMRPAPKAKPATSPKPPTKSAKPTLAQKPKLRNP